jgi:hypothetical protein
MVGLQGLALPGENVAKVFAANRARRRENEGMMMVWTLTNAGTNLQAGAATYSLENTRLAFY